MKSIIAIAKNTLVETLRKRDIYVLAIISALLIAISGMLGFWDARGLHRFVKDISMTIIGICTTIIAIAATARQIPAETECRTLYPLLAKPVSRFTYLLGKFFGCWAIAVSSLLFFTLIFLTALICFQGKVSWVLVQAVFTKSLMLGIIVSLTLFGSTFLTHSANVTVVILFAFGSRMAANAIILSLEKSSPVIQLFLKALYWVIPHVELFDMSKKVVHGWAPIPFWVLLALTGYALIYISLFLALGHIIFYRKPL